MIRLLLFVFISLPILGAENEPSDKKLGTGSLVDYNFHYYFQNSSVALVSRNIPNWNGDIWEQSVFKYRYRPLNWLKVGIGAGVKRGERHNDDWQSEEGQWNWNDTQRRLETVYQLELIPRYQLDNFIFEWRQTLESNSHTNNSSLISRLGVNYFFQGTTVHNFIIQFEKHIPLQEIHAKEEWLYFMYLYHLNNTISLGPKWVLAKKEWNATDEYQDRLDKDFSAQEELQLIGIHLNIRLK